MRAGVWQPAELLRVLCRHLALRGHHLAAHPADHSGECVGVYVLYERTYESRYVTANR